MTILTEQNVPIYLSAKYFALRQQERAYSKEAQHYRDMIDRLRTIDEKMQVIEMAKKAQRQADAISDVTFASLIHFESEKDDALDDFQAAHYVRTLQSKEAKLLRLRELESDDDKRMRFCTRAMRDPAAVEHAIVEKLYLIEYDIARIRARLLSRCQEMNDVGAALCGCLENDE